MQLEFVRAAALATLVAHAALLTPAAARTFVAPARPGAAAVALAGAVDGDTVRLERGVHAGPLHVMRAIVLTGAPGAIVDGAGRGSVIEVGASGAHVEGIELRGSGRSVSNESAAVRIIDAGTVTVRDVRAEDVLYGVYAERATHLVVDRCTLRGRVAPGHSEETSMEASTGNGVHLWYCADATLSRLDVANFTDAIYLSFADRAQVLDSDLHQNGRYGLHTMYCQRDRFERNRFERNAAGCAVMFSNGLEVRGNHFLENRGPRTYGLLLKDCSAGRFIDNDLVDNTIALFMDNSNRNEIRGNLIQDNGWGLLMFSSCAGNVTAGNDFLNNDYPVALDMKYTNNRFDDGAIGNYWSDAHAYDLDGNGVGDVPHSPVSAFAFLSKQYTDLSVLAKSPAVAALSVAERSFPALRPSEAVDHFPRITPWAHTHAPRTHESRRAETAPALAAVFAALGIAGMAVFVRGRAA